MANCPVTQSYEEMNIKLTDFLVKGMWAFVSVGDASACSSSVSKLLMYTQETEKKGVL